VSNERKEPDQIIIYTGSDGQTRVQMRFTGRDVWMTQQQMAALFDVTQQDVSYHLVQIYKEGELDQTSTHKEILSVEVEGNRSVARERKHYNLDAIISVGYRVSSKRATKFRQWATHVLTEYAVKGHVVDVERLKDPAASDHFQELLEKIRDIRSSEQHVWKRVLELASLCNDHDTISREQLEQFYATIQNTVHWGVTQHTAAEIIHDRVDAKRAHCGLTHFKGKEPTVEEANVAKNYYGEPELQELNLLTTRVLDYFEDQTNRRLVVTLDQFLSKLREFIKFDQRPVLPGRGSVSMAEAKRKATKEVKDYKAKLRAEKEAEGEAALRALSGTAASIASVKKKTRKKESLGPVK
jgi:hypothetical protein